MEALLDFSHRLCDFPNLKNYCQAKRQLSPVKLARHRPHSLNFRTSVLHQRQAAPARTIEYQSTSDEHDGKSDQPPEPQSSPVLCSHRISPRILARNPLRQIDSHSTASPYPPHFPTNKPSANPPSQPLGPLRSHRDRVLQVRPRPRRLPPRLIQKHPRNRPGDQRLEAAARADLPGQRNRQERSGTNEAICWEYGQKCAGYANENPNPTYAKG